MGAIADCFSEIFQGADLVPSDISAGLALLAIQDRRMLKEAPKGVLLKPSSAAATMDAASSFTVNEGDDVERGEIEASLLTTNESPRSAAFSSVFSQRETTTMSCDVPIKSSGEMLSRRSKTWRITRDGR